MLLHYSATPAHHTHRPGQVSSDNRGVPTCMDCNKRVVMTTKRDMVLLMVGLHMYTINRHTRRNVHVV